MLGTIQWEKSAAHVNDCEQSKWVAAPKTTSSAQIWKVVKTSTHVQLYQDYRLVFDYKLSDAAKCGGKLSGNKVAKISFNKFKDISGAYKSFDGKIHRLFVTIKLYRFNYMQMCV